mmetsp:Transcript_3842/g.10892  ORF Transcript_3842/g.10892 Transcript_3842/m.10892 type:complete len:719 (-) Transcript_3842:253-2409(-)|eukprot:CAMPEP_0117651422 /NCGR_PEP_ID=MMETSP0804-20121206/2083_1 /TAXON_ID=1074897 /ORGANISM="Tetraselmis astigmatica, Strain CCMP880" /LENGTH=718 /DNA_ID=CAMNT_0005457397 /DNA_START=238 /DNA_END=2394 /DNA_ORIENTATION=+
MSSPAEATSGGSGREHRSKGQKRKLADPTEGTGATDVAPVAEIRQLITVLRSANGDMAHGGRDYSALKRAAHALAEIAKTEENVDLIVKEGGIDATVPLLTCTSTESEVSCGKSDEVQKEACFTLGLLAIKSDHQHRIASAGALSGLIALLKHEPAASVRQSQPSCGGGVIRRAADAITNLAHENAHIKTVVRQEGGIPPLVELLDSMDPKVQRAAAGALRTLAFKNEENKELIVDSGTLPTLIQMLRSDDVGIHYEAVGVIGNLVHSSHKIKLQVLAEGALQPVIGLLSSKCTESQREAALLLGQFATADPDSKAKIVQRGAVPPLISMLTAADLQLKEMAAFALGRLAQNQDNQAGIIHAGGLEPLLDLVDSKNGNLQHNAAFALYGLADNDDNIADIIRVGGVQRLVNSTLIVQPSRDCVQKTLKRLEEKVNGKVLRQVMYMMRSSAKVIQQRTASALARLASDKDELYEIFITKGGLEVLLDMVLEPPNNTVQSEGAAGLFELASKASAVSPVNCEPQPPTQKVYLGEEFVNNPNMSDISFAVEGKQFYAHRIALCASSDAFRAMFSSGYREKEASSIDIPNISWNVFEAMMRCIYTGSVDITPEIAEELLMAADQYLLDTLKRLCENAISQGLTVDNLSGVFELSENFHAPQLAQHAVVFALENYQVVVAEMETTGFSDLMRRMGGPLRNALKQQLSQASAPAVPEEPPVPEL